MNEHTWKFSTTSESTWQELLAACRRAEKSIDLEQYVFGSDKGIDQQFADLFLEKVRSRVKVRLLFDAIGSFPFYHGAVYEELQKAGVEINYHFAILPPPIKRLLPFILRDHRKLLVVDGKEAHIGGAIIQERARYWRDTFVRLEGPVVEELQAAFDTMWKRTLKSEPVGRVKSENEKKEFSIAGNSFHLRDKDLYRAFLQAITGAKNHIYITTPYFFPNEELLRALYFARKRGVDIVFLFPKFSDNRVSDFLSKFFYKRLRKHNIRIYLYTKSILHAKTMMIDGNWASVGSCNFDLLSLWWNYELNVISTNVAFASELEEHFFEDLKTAEEVI